MDRLKSYFVVDQDDDREMMKEVNIFDDLHYIGYCGHLDHGSDYHWFVTNDNHVYHDHDRDHGHDHGLVVVLHVGYNSMGFSRSVCQLLTMFRLFSEYLSSLLLYSSSLWLTYKRGHSIKSS